MWSKLLRELAMSHTELITESDRKIIKTDEKFIAEKISIDDRSYEMLLVLNQVFDSIIPSSKS